MRLRFAWVKLLSKFIDFDSDLTFQGDFWKLQVERNLPRASPSLLQHYKCLKNWVRKWVKLTWTEWKWPSQRPQRPSRPYGGFGKRPRGMCLTPLALYMTNGRLAEWVSASGSPKSARNGTKKGVSNFCVLPSGPKNSNYLSPNVGSIVPKEQNFKKSNERMADRRTVVYSLPQIGQFFERFALTMRGRWFVCRTRVRERCTHNVTAFRLSLRWPSEKEPVRTYRALRESSQRQLSVAIGKLNIENLNNLEHWTIEQIWTLNKLNKLEHWTNWTNLNIEQIEQIWTLNKLNKFEQLNIEKVFRAITFKIDPLSMNKQVHTYSTYIRRLGNTFGLNKSCHALCGRVKMT